MFPNKLPESGQDSVALPMPGSDQVAHGAAGLVKEWLRSFPSSMFQNIPIAVAAQYRSGQPETGTANANAKSSAAKQRAPVWEVVSKHVDAASVEVLKWLTTLLRAVDAAQAERFDA